MALYEVMYSILLTQIKFGTYHIGETLPTIDEASRLFMVSADTINAAYLRLKREGYITLTTNVGAKVRVDCAKKEISRNIQKFFSVRKNALIDLSKSMQILFGKAQWSGLKTASQKTIAELEQLAAKKDILPSYRMIQQLQLIYGSLKNDMLMRLIWQTFIFYQAPFLSVEDNLKRLPIEEPNPLINMLDLCRKKDWKTLQIAVETFQKQLSSALCKFYENKISPKPAGQSTVSFHWSSYEKTSQRCYSLGMSLLAAISREYYSAGTLLPSLETLAKQKQVSVSTVRRTLALLNKIGAVKSINGVGTRVLSIEQIGTQCDFTHPDVQKRLLDFLQSLQILTFSCKMAAQITIASLNTAAIELWKEALYDLNAIGRQHLAPYAALKLISQYAPYDAVRKVYTELFLQLFWGYPLWSFKNTQSDMAFYTLYFDVFIDCLNHSDPAGYAEKLEELMIYELKFAKDYLKRLGIKEAEATVVPEIL